ncbi:MAG: DEAD/DEAH box helicase [Verrucomicrobiales bacterium]|nr:DEAD/DEAH box helicase [Verrucomicrobiales bacterium]
METPPPPDATSFPESRWLGYCAESVARKARKLVAEGRIRNLNWNPTDLLASGTVSAPWMPALRVDVEFDFDPEGGWRFESVYCPCPKRGMCEHAVGVLVALSRGMLHAPELRNPTVPELPADLRRWLDRVQEATADNRTGTPSAESRNPRPTSEALLYLLRPETSEETVSRVTLLETVRARRGRDGTYGKAARYNLLRLVEGAQPAYVQPEDVDIARTLALVEPPRRYPSPGPVKLSGRHAPEVLRRLLATGRCHWIQPGNPPLKPSPARPGRLVWLPTPSGVLRAGLDLTPTAGHLLAFDTVWYVDAERAECGTVETEVSAALLRVWLDAPPLDPVVAATHAENLERRFGAATFPQPRTIPVRRVDADRPTPVLHLDTVRIPWWEAPWGFHASGGESIPVLAAGLFFAYRGSRVPYHDKGRDFRVFDGQELTVIPRDAAAELQAENHLRAQGLVPADSVYRLASNSKLHESWTLEDRGEKALVRFTQVTLPALRDAGWSIERAPDFALEICEPSEWYFETLPESEASENDWFGVELGVRLGNEKINLLPVLLEGLRRNLESFRPENLRNRRAKDVVLVGLPDGRRVPFPAGRLRDILAALVELHTHEPLGTHHRLRVHRLRAAQLGDLADSPNWVWSGSDFLQGLARRMRRFDTHAAPTVPSGLRATLRPYQIDGLGWLQFLREFGLGGVLADDMGLGKTVQTIAHLLAEKEAGRLDRPALVVSPTSVLVNWREEIARFAPDLRVLTLHGNDRHERFGDLSESDVVLTTYALLPRDSDELLKVRFHCVVLDEAQNVKNPKTQAAQVACQLGARHRICLSGTPLENHLGELWSLFNFLIPGFLGDETRFRAVFRQPIERENDAERRTHLARRVRPFLLRRRKDEVARELPAKTEIVQKIELYDAQRDLYETIRLAMQDKVRAAVEKNGVQRSQIVILDALLKLRQVCCDPRLVALESARKATASAKLDDLMERLPTLLEEGRRILLFSQFTGMLALIQERLDAAKIPWLLLTGDTPDRATPVRRFQAREVPLFLLSLKAGGSGLNLTAADTVILFDPWWNPAVEAQAIDRAHRIGQDQRVFVYRLIAAGTVEERMAELQLRKRELVQALLEEGARGSLRLENEDIDLLFAPLEAPNPTR